MAASLRHQGLFSTHLYAGHILLQYVYYGITELLAGGKNFAWRFQLTQFRNFQVSQEMDLVVLHKEYIGRYIWYQHEGWHE